MTLDGDDVEAIARRVAALIAPAQRRLVDAAELAEHLGVKRGWVYAHAAVLGGVRLGSGPRAPLRFDIEVARRVVTGDGQPVGRSRREPPSRPRRRAAAGVQLIEGRSVR